MSATVSARLGPREEALRARLDEQVRAGLVRRIWQRDASLWAVSEAARQAVEQRLGWLDAPAAARHEVAGYETFARQAAADGLTHAVVLGMGGSSLCPEVWRRTVLPVPGRLTLAVLDSTHPGAVRRLEAALPLEHTLFVVSTKSGTTVETLSFYRHFWERLRAAGRDPAPAFAAVTDPGTPLDAEARKLGFRRVFPGPPDVGGRYSALTAFGLVPAALLGLDLGRLLDGADAAHAACREESAANPGLALGVWLAGLAEGGRDKLTLALEPGVTSFSLWLEQLVAESLGKEGRGVLPVAGEPLGAPGAYGEDRIAAVLAAPGTAPAAESWASAMAQAGHPVLARPLAGALALGGECFIWEFAIAVAAAVLGVNAFDEPNVSESKENTNAILAAWSTAGLPAAAGGATRSQASAWIEEFAPPSYIGILAYLPEDDAAVEALGRLRVRLRERTRCATTLGFGPRYLHSTGQLHKGGPAAGAFLFVEERGAPAPPIPGAAYDFATLCAAQAEGDAQSLARRGRPVLRISISSLEELQGLESWF